MQLLDEQEFKDRFKEYLASNDWWIILPLFNSDALTTIEKQYYDGDKNGDFHLLMGGGIPGFSIAFAHKDHMSPDQLLDLGVLDTTLEDLEFHDVLLLCSESTDPVAMSDYMGAMLAWAAQ